MESLVRPEAPTPLSERVRSSVHGWLRWFGVGRLVVSAIAVVAVVAGGYLLLRVPTPPAEATLPYTAGPAGTSGPDPAGPADGGAGASAATAVADDPSEIGAAPSGERTVDRDVTAADPTTATVRAPLVVHVVGAVRAPGVYRLPADARVTDAVTVAGGATATADADALNLAAPLVDGSRIYVPEVGEDATELVTVAPAASGAPAADRSAPAGGEVTVAVDVNRAGPAQLERLPGIGPATAAAIVAERDRNGPFAGVDDLERVPGIGPTRLDALRGLVTT